MKDEKPAYEGPRKGFGHPLVRLVVEFALLFATMAILDIVIVAVIGQDQPGPVRLVLSLIVNMLLLLAYAGIIRLIVLTKGADGSVLRAAEEQSVHPGSRVEVADTVGAGDAFTAATIIGLLKGHSLDRINALANSVASHVCSQPGATPEIPGSLRAALDA